MTSEQIAPLSISVIIPVHNGGDAFRQCLASVAAALPGSSELIVVADGDTDDSWRLAEHYGARVLRSAICHGPAYARNQGAHIASGDILFFVDADVTIPPDALDHVAKIFATDPHLTALFGSYDDKPAAPNFLSQYKNLLHHYVHQTAREDASTFWGACGAIRRESFWRLGGFNERYRFPSIEDVELGYRLKKTGCRIRLIKALQVKHLKRWSIVSLLKADICFRALPWTELILHERHVLNDLNFRLSSRASTLLVFALTAAVVGAIWWPSLLVVVGGLMLALLACNAPLYRFFLKKRGVWFTFRVVPWHWLYYGYSGLAFIAGSLFFLLPGSKRTAMTQAGEVFTPVKDRRK